MKDFKPKKDLLLQIEKRKVKACYGKMQKALMESGGNGHRPLIHPFIHCSLWIKGSLIRHLRECWIYSYCQIKPLFAWILANALQKPHKHTFSEFLRIPLYSLPTFWYLSLFNSLRLFNQHRPIIRMPILNMWKVVQLLNYSHSKVT